MSVSPNPGPGVKADFNALRWVIVCCLKWFNSCGMFCDASKHLWGTRKYSLRPLSEQDSVLLLQARSRDKRESPVSLCNANQHYPCLTQPLYVGEQEQLICVPNFKRVGWRRFSRHSATIIIFWTRCKWAISFRRLRLYISLIDEKSVIRSNANVCKSHEHESPVREPFLFGTATIILWMQR